MIDEVVPEPATVPHLLHSGVDQWGDEEFLLHDGAALTWREVERRSAGLAKGLLSLGTTKGSRIGILMPNSSDWIVAFLAVTRIGALVSPLSTFQQSHELHRALAFADIQILLCRDRFLAHDYREQLEQIPGLSHHAGHELYLSTHPHLRHIVVWGDSDRPWAVSGPEGLEHRVEARPGLDDRLLEAAEASVTPADWLLTIWTSGTTSDPKGVVHTHGSVIRYCHGLRAMGRGDLRRGERSYSAMPFFWLGGLNSQVIPALMCGGVIVTTDQVAPEPVVAMLLDQGVSRVSGWFRPLAELRRASVETGADVSHIRGLAQARFDDGTPVPDVRVANALGMTETFGPVAAEAPGSVLPPDKAGAFGRSVADFERIIVDVETGREVPSGTIGELWVRGPAMMVGYYKRERESTFEKNGFFRTGDRCSIDASGYLYWHGRLGDVIKTSGANVSPAELEQLLMAYDDVAEAVVLGVPDESRDEAIMAVLVPSQGSQIDPDEITARIRRQVSSYKVPHAIVVVTADEIPRTDSGKPRKHVLAEALVDSWPQNVRPTLPESG